MPPFRIEDGFFSHPKTMRAGNSAIGMWVRMGSYCSTYLTDGHVPASAVFDLGTKRDLDKLLHAGFVIKHPSGDYLLHEYLERNPTRAKVEEERKAARVRANARRTSGEHPPKQRRRTFGDKSVPTEQTAGAPAREALGGAARCETHMLPMPCRGCAADEKAAC